MNRNSMKAGDSFNSLVFIQNEPRQGHGLFFCKPCASFKSIYKADVKREKTKSCGCLNDHVTRATHQMSGTPTHISWKAMLSRVRNPLAHGYQSYELSVCPEWDPQQGGSFESFLADMGERPDGKTLDRFPDNKGAYSPDNCRWATEEEQLDNRDITRCSQPGETNPGAKLNNDNVLEIRSLKNSGSTPSELAKMFNVSVSLIRKIISGARWGHI